MEALIVLCCSVDVLTWIILLQLFCLVHYFVNRILFINGNHADKYEHHRSRTIWRHDRQKESVRSIYFNYLHQTNDVQVPRNSLSECVDTPQNYRASLGVRIPFRCPTACGQLSPPRYFRPRA